MKKGDRVYWSWGKKTGTVLDCDHYCARIIFDKGQTAKSAIIPLSDLSPLLSDQSGVG